MSPPYLGGHVLQEAMNHPHLDKLHVMRAMRRYLVAEKAKRGTARNLGHYHELLQTYLTAKRQHYGN